MEGVRHLPTPANGAAANGAASNGAAAAANGAAPNGKPSPAAAAIKIDGGSFSWSPDGAPTLHDVTLEIPKGALAIVVGPVGCGKSSLLSAILGEMDAVEPAVETEGGAAAAEAEGGDAVVETEGAEGAGGAAWRRRGAPPVGLAGSVAYTAQDPWIQNATLRNNILMVRGLARRGASRSARRGVQHGTPVACIAPASRPPHFAFLTAPWPSLDLRPCGVVLRVLRRGVARCAVSAS